MYVGTDATNVDGIAEADHVARWDGSGWSAVGDNGAGNGWFTTPGTVINALAGTGTHLFATGTFLDANGEARADNVAFFDGTAWHPVGSDGAANGPWSGNGLALAIVGQKLYAAGSFTSAGGDQQARSVASFALTSDHRVPDAYGDPGPRPGPDADGDSQPDA